jgi:pimeloyl-ACP methyl ester carboxylesterase
VPQPTVANTVISANIREHSPFKTRFSANGRPARLDAVTPDLAYFDPGDARRIAYRLRAPADAHRPTLLFLPGYASDMEGTKALAVDAFAAATGCGCLRLDYSGTGSSGGKFEDGTLARWLDEVVAAIDRLIDGGIIPIGSSMGGWIALHAALRRPDRIAALVGIAAAPDFTDWGFSADDKIKLLQDGQLVRPDPYREPGKPDPGLTTRALWQSGEALRLLGAPIAIDCPVRLLHGEKDETVPVGVPLKLLAQLRSADVQLTLIKDGGHRLSEPREIDALLRCLAPLVETS